MRINFKQSGSGKSVILLHGFPFNHSIWDDFASALSSDFKVITPDLPGFGSSDLLVPPFSIADVADRLIQWVEENSLEDAVLVGHSLGGYVALAMIKKKPSLFVGLVLFHSTAYADSVEKKESRLKVLSFLEQHGVEAFTSNFIPPLFADQKHVAIEKVRAISVQATSEAVLGYTIAMKNRPELTDVLKDFEKPILIITGEQDGGIPVETIFKQSEGTTLQIKVMKHVAHMGMFEAPEESASLLKSFIMQISASK